MATKIRQINRDIKKFSEAIGLDLGTVVRKITEDTHGKIVERTPVDTGRARASWDVAVGAPSDFPGPPATKQPGIANGGSETYPKPETPSLAEVDGTEPVYIVSNLVYMEPLENGHSKKAPKGMVRIAIAEVVAEIDTTLSGLGN